MHTLNSNSESADFQLIPTSTKLFVNHFQRLGIGLSTDKMHRLSIRSYLILIAGILLMVLSLCLSIQQWNYMNIRVSAFTKFGEYSICTLTFGYMVFNPDHCVELFNVIDSPLGILSRNWNHKQRLIRNEAIRSSNTALKVYIAAAIILWLFSNFAPCIFEIVTLLIKPSHNIKTSDLFFSLFFIQYLTSTKSVIIFSIMSLLQSFLYLTLITYSAVHYSVAINAIKIVEADLKILCISVKELGDNLSTSTNISSVLTKENNSGNTESLKERLSNIIKHHQAIVQSVRKLNKAAGFLILAFNGIVTAQFSLELYCTLETEDPWMHFLRIPGSIVCYGFFCFFGQDLINEGDNLKQTVEWFPWIDTPRWFKKSLIVMTTCTKKPLEVKPSGLYVLNSRNWMSVIQAGYSYLNMMRSFKANRL